MESWTPMVAQYRQIKSLHPDKLLFFRLGDFYELFFEDAEIASRELEITLTSREAGKGNRIAMCGVPHHAAESYIARLIDKGFKVAICEQVEDPKVSKGIVAREVVRIVTPGTVLSADVLPKNQNNFLASVAFGEVTECANSKPFGLALADVSTGEFLVSELDCLDDVLDELSRASVKECLVPEGIDVSDIDLTMCRQGGIVTVRPAEQFRFTRARDELLSHFKVPFLKMLGLPEAGSAISAAGALLCYLRETFRRDLRQITCVKPLRRSEYMTLDLSTRRSLELTFKMMSGRREGTLLWALDETVTPMGGRLLGWWIEHPLISLSAINARLDAVEELVNRPLLRDDMQQILKQVYDLERLVSRACAGTVTPRELGALRSSLSLLPRLFDLISKLEAAKLKEVTERLRENLPQALKVLDLLANAVVDDPPISPREGNLIRDGYSAAVDELRAAVRDGRNWVLQLEESERQRTGIKSLKVGFNKVFGYYIEVTHANRQLVPADYERKQTLSTAERYVTPELKQKEALVLGAEEKLVALEYELFCQLRDFVASNVEPLKVVASAIAELDVLCGFAKIAVQRGYVRPLVNDSDNLIIKSGRHPVLELIMAPGEFVPNDCKLNCDDHRLLIVTGPNMAGKSTFLRQVALITLMAQVGSFVPASYAEIGVVDRIFARVGASDDIAQGQSTFMVEMTEMANILRNATSRSLIILDEVGRGTSTYDGLSIAWASSEYIHDKLKIGARTLFATHYHELTVLEEVLAGVKNYSVAVKEQGRQIIFLRRIVPGGTDRSYGIHVARLAGLPSEVIDRAEEILKAVEARPVLRRASVRRALFGFANVVRDSTGSSQGFASGSGEMAPFEQINFWQEKG